MSPIPNEVTTGDLARVLGISERRVATLKAEGRIPTSDDGHVLLLDLIGNLYRENANWRQRATSNGPRGKLGFPPTWDEAHPGDAMARVALSGMATLLPEAVKGAAKQIGIDDTQAARLAEQMRCTALDVRDDAMQLAGILSDPDAPPREGRLPPA